MITKVMTDRLFEVASIQRWNDPVRPVKFTELDKQPHKMIIAVHSSFLGSKIFAATRLTHIPARRMGLSIDTPILR